MSVVSAGHPEILRAAQRDESIQNEISQELAKLVSGFFGVTYLIKWRNVIDVGARLLYQSITTLQTVQTIGEEYTGILQWKTNNIPSLQVRLVMVLLNSLADRSILGLIKAVKDKLENLPQDTKLRPEAKKTLLRFLFNVEEALPFFIRFHQTLFYFQGTYYDISKRFTGVNYRLVRFWLRDISVAPVFRILGITSLLHLIFTGFAAIRQRNLQDAVEEVKSAQVSSMSSGDTCPLCLNIRTNSTCTPCGHLFCWNCIIPWVHEQPECPICRHAFPASRLVLLKNFV